MNDIAESPQEINDDKSSSILSNDEDQALIIRKSLEDDHFELEKSEIYESSESISQHKLMP